MTDVSEPASPVGTTPQRRRVPRFFYGWYIVLAGAGMQAMSGALFSQAYGGYVVLLREEFGWSKTMLAGASSLREAESGITSPIQGPLLDRFGPRTSMRVGVVIFGAGFMLFSHVQSPLTFYLAFIVMSVGASATGFLPTTYTVVQWFERKRSTAIGFTSAGFAVGGMCVPLTVLSMETFGWRQTAFASGIIIIVLGLVLTHFIRRNPEELGLRVDGDPVEEHSAGKRPVASPDDFTLREALHTPAFWLVGAGHASALFVVSAMSVHLLSYLSESLGYSLGAAATFVLLMTILQFAGTLTGGLIGDRLNKRYLAIVCMGMHASGLLLLSHAENVGMVIGFALLHGLAWGWRGPQMMAIRADYFGRGHFGKIMGTSSLIIIIGTISGPIIAGVLYDTTGSYRLGFDILAMIAAVGSVFFLLARKPAPPRRGVRSETA